jgi:hypothetical protein
MAAEPLDYIDATRGSPMHTFLVTAGVDIDNAVSVSLHRHQSADGVHHGQMCLHVGVVQHIVLTPEQELALLCLVHGES